MINGTIPHVEGNIFRKNGDGLHVVQSGREQVVRGNRFEGNEVGLRCENFSTPLVEENEFAGNGDAIFCFQASSPMIRRNSIADNRRGIACSRISSPRVVANEIRDNGKGIHLTLSSYAVVNGNNIHGNGVQIELGDMSADWERRVRKKPERGAQAQLATRISRGKASREELAVNTDDRAALMDAVDATGNWWGGEDTEEMERKGPRADIRRLIDGYDVPVRTYVGYPGEYAQDRIRYDGWEKSRIPDAGAPPKGKETGK
jgi:parallel beta-helix repeat protein